MERAIRYVIIISINLHYVLTAENWIPFRTSRNLAMDLVNQTEKNLTQLPENDTIQNSSEKRSNPNEFWLLRNENGTEDASPVPSSDAVVAEVPQSDETSESAKPIPLDDPEWMKEYEMNELLFMSRNNCNLELQINEWEDRKLKIQYETPKNEMTGQCRLSLRGKNGIFLAVLVSNVQLNGKQFRDSSAEVLRIIIRSNHFDYTLKEYRGNDDYYPVMLTESDHVNLILVFNGINATGRRSSYNLEVFNYYKRENNISAALQQSDDHYGYGNSTQDVDKIFITTAVP